MSRDYERLIVKGIGICTPWNQCTLNSEYVDSELNGAN